MFRALKLTLVFLPLLFSVPAYAQMEALCSTLGSQCLCSETLDFFTDLSALPSRYLDPTNSADAYECTSVNADYCGTGIVQQCGEGMTLTSDYTTSGTAMVRASTYAPFPSGADPWVWKSTAGGIQHIIGRDFPAMENETACIRAYKGYEGMSIPIDTTPSGGNQRMKGIQILTQGGGHIDPQWWTGGNASLSYIATLWDENPLCKIVGYYDCAATLLNVQADSVGVWSRMEVCADVSASNTANFRIRITYLDDNHSVEDTSPTATGVPTPANFAAFFTGFGQNMAGFQYTSHVMQTRGAYDPTFWIGGASELETPGPHVVVSNNGPVQSDQAFQLTVTPNNFSGVDANSYKFDLDDDNVNQACVTEGGTIIGACDAASCTCEAPASITTALGVGSHALSGEADELSPSGPYTGTTTLTVTAPPAPDTVDTVFDGVSSTGVSAQ